jgi:hypothetical protein
MTDDKSTKLPHWAQVFGSLSPVVVGVVAATTVGGLAVVLLSAVGTALICAAAYVGLSNRTGMRKYLGTALNGVIGLGLVVWAVLIADAGRSSTPPGSAQTQTAPQPEAQSQRSGGGFVATRPVGDRTLVTEKSGYQLVPSSNPLSNHEDKVDLDTGCPGWGPTSVRVGRNRCGDVADLIIEAAELHSPNYTPTLALLGGATAATYETCRDSISSGLGTLGSIPLGDLAIGAELCVATDKGNVAAVRVDSVDPAGGIIISFQVWR